MSDPSRVAVVVGGASGIGAACATALEADGCTVVVADLPEVDVTSEPSVSALLDRVVADHGRVDVVVNSAGVSTLMAVADHDVAEFRRVVDVNLTGGLVVLKHAARVLGPGGSITSLTSLNARQPGSGMAAYCSAKAGLAMLTEVAALELGPRGIRVNAVSPGLVVTPLTEPAMGIPGTEDDYLANTPLGRAGTPAEVASAVVWISRAEWLTGEVLDLNGGAHLQRYPDLLGHVARAFG
ncbi:SDR family NAD(P)-dependent oxidoreductase [Nocardioides lianchengensis]|uniref:NAD(P)-dependent dehydrogenase, short-chain alcohol dehydrogenase family n=1 Tax=Nocardioides lianchengensis TaxID=1045774 RepID=A0A1G7AGI9_9ACTN|nr:SDR family oxidoreductase [Nocardioides lianchengensis]NYG13584.1 NAD(P)-dependent dehydrogenase (short-subunit alcohol dehydrogenase family) [Nocardioides lianchengensis]SDE13941.1 NAD(P)-dependent dehydrogenase, short-chain alcohol dehydrogenase family [Nocardioides lianchengensis]